MGLGIICSGQGNQNLNMFSSLNAYSNSELLISNLTKQLSCQLLPQILLSDEELFHNHHAQPLITGLIK